MYKYDVMIYASNGSFNVCAESNCSNDLPNILTVLIEVV